VVDGITMNATPQRLIAEGKFNKNVPVLMGSNRDEFAAFIQKPRQHFFYQYPQDMNETHFDALLAYLGSTNVKAVKQLYDPSVYAYPKNRGNFSQWWWTAMRVATDNGIPAKGWPVGPALGHCSVRRVAANLLKGGAPSVHIYHFETPLGNPNRAMHGMEIPFVFHWVTPSPTHVFPWGLGISRGNHELSSAMANYWTRFAAYGDPNHGSTKLKLPLWPAYDPSHDKANIKLDATLISAVITPEKNLRGDACDFWDKLAGVEPAASSEIIV
jgi:para-nitrobenzyl esterase